MDDLQSNLLPEIDLQVDENIKLQFIETAKWSKFISIVMFVFAGLILLFGIAGGSMFSGVFDRLGGEYANVFRMGGSLVIIAALFISLVLAIVYYFLFLFAVKIKNAMLTENSEELTGGLKMLKVYFIVTTIFAILTLLNDIKNLF